MNITHFEVVTTAATGALLGVFGVIAALYKLYRWAKPIVLDWVALMADLRGEDARVVRGVEIEPAKPGLALRLHNLDDGQANIIGTLEAFGHRLKTVEGQVMQDHGHSMHDKIDRTLAAVTGSSGSS